MSSTRDAYKTFRAAVWRSEGHRARAVLFALLSFASCAAPRVEALPPHPAALLVEPAAIPAGPPASARATPPPSPVARPPFAFALGSPTQLVADDPNPLALASWRQRERGEASWGKHADVAAGPTDEWLIDVSHYAVIVSPESGGFWYRDLGDGGVSSMEAHALTGGPKKDVVVTYWTLEGSDASGYRHGVLEVWSFGEEGPRVRLAIELSAWARCCGSEAHAPPHESVSFRVHEGAIDLSRDRPWRIDSKKWSPTTPPGVLPRMPAAVKRRVYRWDGSEFRVEAEERGT